jgi:hypothetical protein
MINVAPVILFGVELDKLAMPGSDRDWGRGSFHEITSLKDPGWSRLACKAGFSASNLEPCFQRTVQADCRGESTVLFLVSDRQRPAGLGRREHVEIIHSNQGNSENVMKPVFANMMGQFGQNTIFVVFPGKGADGDQLIDPYKEGQLSFVENGHSFSWRLPLGSLLPDETCPKCGEVLPGNYKFCPYDGTKLEPVPVPASSPGS